ncbi:hypothetical protein KKG31_07220 [Patescibacteria group bacterium]|nr:hypothetical protein [Patescibacteria group bacterium]
MEPQLIFVFFDNQNAFDQAIKNLEIIKEENAIRILNAGDYYYNENTLKFSIGGGVCHPNPCPAGDDCFDIGLG